MGSRFLLTSRLNKLTQLRQLSKFNPSSISLIRSSSRFNSDSFTDTSNNEIEAYVANKEYGIEPRHLATIRAKQIRSPYKNRTKILVWREEEIKNFALQKYTTEEAMNRAIRRKMKIRMSQAEKLKEEQDSVRGKTKHKNVIFHSEADIILDEVIKEY